MKKIIFQIVIITFSFVLYGQNNSTLKDTRDGKIYNTVLIGEQWWMAENLNYKTNNSLVYENIETNASVKGRLYTYYEAVNVCPAGWHLPTDEEWYKLELSINMNVSEVIKKGWRGDNKAIKLKSNIYDNLSTNETGFSAIPGGYAYDNGTLYFVYPKQAYFWTSTSVEAAYAYNRIIDFVSDKDFQQIYRGGASKGNYCSVRCVIDK